MTFPSYYLEDIAKAQGYNFIVGVDEVGRGPGAGPVTASAVYIPDDAIHKLVGKVNDSKKLSSKRRDELYDIICEYCRYGIHSVEANIIDKINILEATKLAMKLSIEKLGVVDYVLVDGTVDLSKHTDLPHKQIIGGDGKSISIAAASILAKVTRDRIMVELDRDWGIYNWKKNKGYLTAEHMDAINTYGITEHHRVSFRRVGK